MIEKIKFIKKYYPNLFKGGAIGSLVFAVLITGSCNSASNNIGNIGGKTSVGDWILAVVTHPIFLVISFVIIFLLVMYVAGFVFYDDNGEYYDTREFSETEEHGTAHPMTFTEAEKKFPVYCLEDNECRNNLLGWYNRSKLLAFTYKIGPGGFNGHMMVCAKSGGGKSTSFVFPMLMQIIRRGESFVVTDTSGETAEWFQEYCKDMGYEVRIIMPLDPSHSDGFNPMTMFDYSKDPVLTAETIANLIADNREKDQNYYAKATLSFLSFLLIFVAKPGEDKSFGGCGRDANNRHLASVLELALSNKNELLQSLKSLDKSNPARIAASSWAEGDSKHQEQPIATVRAWMSVLLAPTVRQMISHNDTDLRAPGLRKCAYFVSTPAGEKGATMNWLTAVLYGALLDVLQDVALEHENKLPVPVNLVFDEFPNIFHIPGWAGTMNEVRKKNIRGIMIYQGRQDMERAYPEQEESLDNACDITVFLGTNDRHTAEFFEKKSGEATVMTERSNELGGNLRIKSHSVSESTTKSYAFTADRLMKLNENDTHDAIIFTSQQNPLRVPTIYFEDHPDFKYLKQHFPGDHIPLWKQSGRAETDVYSLESDYRSGFAEAKTNKISHATDDRKTPETERSAEENKQSQFKNFFGGSDQRKQR